MCEVGLPGAGGTTLVQRLETCGHGNIQFKWIQSRVAHLALHLQLFWKTDFNSNRKQTLNEL